MLYEVITYVWGREFTCIDSTQAGKLEIDKHWYKFLLWGRLAYNNQLDSTFFIAKIAERYPKVDATELYSGWKIASQIIPKVNCYHWNDWDYQWSVEACFDARNGFHDINRFIVNPTLQNSGLISPKAYAMSIVKSKTIEGITPYQAADA